MTSDEQLERWVAGESIHCDHVEIPIVDDGGQPTGQMATPQGGMCCPDFSCCRPELAQPLEVRQQFMQAGPQQRSAFLYTFLGAMMATALAKTNEERESA